MFIYLSGHRDRAERLKAADRRHCRRIHGSINRNRWNPTIYRAQNAQRNLDQMDMVIALTRLQGLVWVQMGCIPSAGDWSTKSCR